MSINGQGHSLTLVKGHSDFKVKRLTFGLYTQVSNSGPLGPLVLKFLCDGQGTVIYPVPVTGLVLPCHATVQADMRIILL